MRWETSAAKDVTQQGFEVSNVKINIITPIVLLPNFEWSNVNTDSNNSLITGYNAVNDFSELHFAIVISDNEISQYTSNQSEINVSISIDVFGNWQSESIYFYINDNLEFTLSHIETPENGWNYPAKQEWSQYGICISCDTTQNGYTTYTITDTWTQDINSLFKCFVTIFYPE